MPVLVGLDRSEALRLIKRAGLVAGTATSIDSDQRVGQVLSSRPEAGATVKRGTRVDFEFSAGVRVPELAGLRRRPAEAALTAAGLTTGGVTVRCSTQPGGQVLASTPGAGSHVSSGSAVALVVSKRGAEVPSVVGQSSAAASSALSGAGFAVRTRPRLVDDPSKAGVVLSQNVAPGTCAQPGATVAIVVGVEGQSGPGPGPDPEPGSVHRDAGLNGPAEPDGLRAGDPGAEPFRRLTVGSFESPTHHGWECEFYGYRGWASMDTVGGLIAFHGESLRDISS